MEVCHTPALAKLICLEGADEPTYLKAERHLEQTGGIAVSARQIQRVVQRVGSAAQSWQEREAQPGACAVPILYASGDGTGACPCGRRRCKGAKASKPMARPRHGRFIWVAFSPSTVPMTRVIRARDHESTTYVSSFKPIGDFGPLLRQEALRRGLGNAGQVVLLIDGAAGLENMGRDCFQDSVQIVDFYHALEHAGHVLAALIGKDHPDYKKRQSRWARRLLEDQVQNLIAETRKECAGQPRETAVAKATGLLRAQRPAHAVRNLPGPKVTSLAPGSWRPAAKPSSAAAANNPACSGRSPGAQNILALRCIHSSRRLDEFWKYRLNQRAARNDALAFTA